MAKKKRLGGKVIFRVAGTVIGFITSVSPPEKMRSETDTTTMEDTIETFLDADPIKIGNLKVECHWDHQDADDEALDTLIANSDVDARDVSIEIEFRASLRKYAFTGRLIKLTPKQVKQKDVIAREIEIRPTSVLTKSTVT